MAKGTILGTTNNQYIDAKVEWSSVANNDANTSVVTASLYYRRNNTGYTTSGHGEYNLTINGDTKWIGTMLQIAESWVLVVTHTVTVTHNSDGRKSITISASGGMYDESVSLQTTTLSGTVTLDAIPRASTLDSLSCDTTYLTGTMTYKYTPQVATLYNRCLIYLYTDGETTFNTLVKDIKLGQKAASQQTATVKFSESELSTIYNKLPSTTKGILRFLFYTYNDSGYSDELPGATSKLIELNIPNDDSTQPSVSMSLSPVSSLSSPYNSLYLQGHSKVKATLSFGTEYGATVTASSITVNGNNYASPYETDILSQAGKVSVKATVKDSRGFYGTNYKEIDVIPYEKPYVQAKSGENSIIAARCDSSANFTDSGTYLKIKAKIVYSKVISGGVQNNYGNIKFRYRKEGGAYSAWQTILNCKTDNSDEVITPPLLNGALDIKSNYQVQIIASDDLYDSVAITIAIPSDDVYMDRPAGGKSMGLGGYSTGDGRFDVYWKTMARGGLSLFDSKGDEVPLDTTMPLPRDQIKGTWNADTLECGVHVVANNNALKQGDTVIMYNGVLLQMKGDVSGNVLLQLALPVDANRNPMYRLCWYSNWSDWRSLKL